MKNGIPSQNYYELLEWKDTHMDEFLMLYPGKRLTDLTVIELIALYNTVILES